MKSQQRLFVTFAHLVQRRELGEEFRILLEYSHNLVERHPGFEHGDAKSLRRMQRLLPAEMR